MKKYIYDAVSRHREESGFNELEDETKKWLENQGFGTYFLLIAKAFQDGYTIAKNKYKTIK